MLDFISGDVRQYMERKNLKFTDFEMAAIVYHSGLTVPEKQERLEKIAEAAEDETVREQISERLAMEREEMKAFCENAEGYVYVLEIREYPDESYIYGYFATADLAYIQGRKQGFAFEIEKYRIIGSDAAETGRARGYWNPYVFEREDMAELVEEFEDEGIPVAVFRYNEEGVLEWFSSRETGGSDEEEMERLFSPLRFENAFLSTPNPFERGDIVRLLPDGGRGIVETSQEEWREFLEKVNGEGRMGVDFSDAGITVEFVREGRISHGHVNPIFLEKDEPRREESDYKLITAASDLLKGRGSLEWFADQLISGRQR